MHFISLYALSEVSEATKFKWCLKQPIAGEVNPHLNKSSWCLKLAPRGGGGYFDTSEVLFRKVVIVAKHEI